VAQDAQTGYEHIFKKVKGLADNVSRKYGQE
jgi:hypothetical protein